MVNFESDQLLTTNKGEILNLIILGRRDDLLNIFQKWREDCISNSAGKTTQEYKLRGSLFTLFLELERPLFRHLNKTSKDPDKDSTKENKNKVKFEKLKAFVYNDDTVEKDDIISAYDTINTFLDDINLTKIDTKKNFDSRNLEEENEHKGL